VDRGRR